MLASLAGDPLAAVRRAVMAALVRSGGAAATLSAGLDDADWQVREEASASLGKSGAVEASGKLIVALQDPAWQVRIRAAGALGKLGIIAAVPVLSATLGSEISNLRKEAASALGEIGSASALPYLEWAAADPDPDVRKIVRWAIGKCAALTEIKSQSSGDWEAVDHAGEVGLRIHTIQLAARWQWRSQRLKVRTVSEWDLP